MQELPEGTYHARGRIRRFLSLFSVVSAGFNSPLSGFDRLGLFADIRHSVVATVSFDIGGEFKTRHNFQAGISYCQLFSEKQA